MYTLYQESVFVCFGGVDKWMGAKERKMWPIDGAGEPSGSS